jgi:exonuclease SbcD
VVRAGQIPRGFVAVLSGHIHRYQVLRKDLQNHPLHCPVLYPGSVERTSMAERYEHKGYIILKLELRHGKPATLSRATFHKLPTRPMHQIRLNHRMVNEHSLQEHLKTILGRLPPDSVVQIKVQGSIGEESSTLLSAPVLRTIAPETMNIYVSSPFSAASRDRGPPLPQSRHGASDPA